MPTAPTCILLLQGFTSSGEGSVKQLEQALRKRGWSRTVYLRTTLITVSEKLHERFDYEARVTLALPEKVQPNPDQVFQGVAMKRLALSRVHEMQEW